MADESQSPSSGSSSFNTGCISASVTVLVALIGLATALIQSGLLNKIIPGNTTPPTSSATVQTTVSQPPPHPQPPINSPLGFVAFKSLVVPPGSKQINFNGVLLSLRTARLAESGDANTPCKLTFAFSVDNKGTVSYTVDDSTYYLHVFPTNEKLQPQVPIQNVISPGQKEVFEVIYLIPTNATGATLSLDVPGHPKPMTFGFKF